MLDSLGSGMKIGSAMGSVSPSKMKVGLGNGGPGGAGNRGQMSGASSLMSSDREDKGPRPTLAGPNFRAMKNRDQLKGNVPGNNIPGMARRAGLKRGTSSAGLSKSIFGSSKRP